MKLSFLFLLILIQNIISYDPRKAISYAKEWAHKRNPKYHDYSNEGGDCANFVSQCLIAGGFSTSGCYGNYGPGGTIPYVPNIETCLVKKGWKKATSMPAKGVPAGGVITFNSGSHTALIVEGGTNPLIAGHTTDVWMGSSNYGTRTYFWDPKASPGSGSDSGDGSKKRKIKWFNYVNGYDTNNSNNGFAGDYGKAVVALRVKGATYAVHETGGQWLKEVRNNRIAGRGKPIDGVAIKGGVKYRVHIKGGSWLPAVTGYNFKDNKNGYAGILGKTIDAVAIHGKTYATGY
jgi:hypothetical protein